MVDVLNILRVFLNYINGLLDSFSVIKFSVGSVELNFLDLIVGGIAMLLIFSVFLKGAKT